MHDGHVESGFNSIVEKDAVENVTDMGRQAKGDIADPQQGVDAGKFFLDPADCLERLNAGPPEFFIT